ncbi:MAG: hypothetical protein HY290_08140 [Planctomycetia bacterium]|nr:hypothetical protein [Planctomycetia bacterium]
MVHDNSTFLESLALVGAGISVIPTGPNKEPAWDLLPRDENDLAKPTWKPFQRRLADC